MPKNHLPSPKNQPKTTGDLPKAPENQPAVLRIPITNVYAKGDYTASLKVGSEEITANVILDTGSSTLALHPKNYAPESDQALKTTSFAQDVTYGIGGWTGPVIKTQLTLLGESHHVATEQSHIALASISQSHSFGDADGIFGLAYHGLNKSYNLSNYYQQHQITPAATYPWHFPIKSNNHAIRNFKKFLRQYPEQDITPFFTDLEIHGITKNKFAFYTKRSSIHHATEQTTTEQLNQDPLNQGLFVLGGGEEQVDLHMGNFQSIKVFHDVYYNTHLAGIQVEGCEFIQAPMLETHYEHLYFTNSIVDSGASAILLNGFLYDSLIKSLGALNANFKQTIEKLIPFDGTEHGIPLGDVNTFDWPNIIFHFADNNGATTSLKCPPETYWQENAPSYGLISFKIISQLPHWPNQSIIGLPLLNNYFTVFDRSASKTGCIKFASIKP